MVSGEVTRNPAYDCPLCGAKKGRRRFCPVCQCPQCGWEILGNLKLRGLYREPKKKLRKRDKK